MDQLLYYKLTSILGLFSGVILGLWHALILSTIVSWSWYDLKIQTVHLNQDHSTVQRTSIE